MSDSEKPPLAHVFDAKVASLAEHDALIKRFRGEIKKHNETLKATRQKIAVANGAIRNQMCFLKRQAAAYLRDKTGTNAIPGHAPKETAKQARERVERLYREQMEAAKVAMEQPPEQETPQ